MTEETVISPESVTDEMVDQFFSNDGDLPEKIEEVKSEAPIVDKEPVEEAPKEEKKVNLGALHEERAKRKAEAAARQQAERERDELRARVEEYTRSQQPSFEEDPIESLRAEHNQVKQILITQARQALAEKENSEYWGKIGELESEFKESKPDFDAAIKNLAESRLEELQDIGWDAAAAQKILSDEIKWISDKALDDGVNPAERLYKLAMRRNRPAVNEAPAVNLQQANKLQNIKKGMETNKSLPPGSKSSNQDFTLEDLAAMTISANDPKSLAEYDRIWAKLIS
jgi:hypothetical protein